MEKANENPGKRKRRGFEETYRRYNKKP